MPLYAALIYTPDVDWSQPQPETPIDEYREFQQSAAAILRGGNVLYPTSTATTLHRRGGKDGEVVTSDGPYTETKEVLAGFYLLDCADLDEAIGWAARIPATWQGGQVEVRPVIAQQQG